MLDPKDRDRTISKNVLTLRGDRSQQSVADAMRARGHRWSQATVWAVEKGERPLKLTEAYDLAAALGVALDQLLSPPEVTELQRSVLDL